MEHLAEGRLTDVVWERADLSEAERMHLRQCDNCQQRVASLQLLSDELAIARQSQVTADAEAKLFSILAQAQEREPLALDGLMQKLVASWVGWVNGLPLWDSRAQGAAVGLRNGNNRSSYRMLFGANDTEVELMVEPQNGLLRIVGEVMVGETETSNGLALIELMAYADAKSAIEAESDASGYFALDHVPPGIYVMTVTPRYSKMMVIEPLELT